ncbi:MAG TPA: hypothetical protein DDZ51_26200 [Planctomycetaceae bacterium]|nr:hypothetical protein [Planctomycetaceae bacterium]
MIWWASGISVLMFLGTLVAIPILLVRMPEDYFVSQPVRDWPTRHPAIHIALVLIKNLVGFSLLLAGVSMLILPGQGLLTMLAGLTLLDFPGKRKFELWMINHRPLRQAANWVRRKNNRPPLRLPAGR